MRSTGEIISQTVYNLLMEAVRDDQEALTTSTPVRIYNQKLRELADFMKVSRPYMPRKVQAGTWDANDLDKLAMYFNKYPMDFVPGPHDDWGPGDEASDGARGTEGDRQNPAPEDDDPGE